MSRFLTSATAVLPFSGRSNRTTGLQRIRTRFLVTIGLLLISATAIACNVPVFRYALEHWQPDAYRVRVISGRELSMEELQFVEDLRELSESEEINCVVTAESIEVTESAANESTAAKVESGPRLMVNFPAVFDGTTTCWQAPLTAATIRQLKDSPARRQLIERLTSGQSAVWLLVGGADDDENQRVEKFVSEELRKLQSRLELPELTDAPEDRIQAGPELRVEFSLIRLNRKDEAEALLLNTLLNSEPDLSALNEPCLFPVFGRGRAFLPLVGAGISEENLRETAAFVVGACSCQVKEQNPGFDLLIAANWKTLMPWATTSDSDGMGLLRGDIARDSAEPRMLPIAPGRPDRTPPTEPSAKTLKKTPNPGFWVLITGGSAVLFTFVISFWRRMT